MLSIRPEAGEVFDLPVSGMLRDCLLPVKSPLGVANGPVTMARDEREPGEQRETYRGYTYQRRRVRRESGNWKDGEPGSGRAREGDCRGYGNVAGRGPRAVSRRDEATRHHYVRAGRWAGAVRSPGLPGRRDGTLAHRDASD